MEFDYYSEAAAEVMEQLKQGTEEYNTEIVPQSYHQEINSIQAFPYSMVLPNAKWITGENIRCHKIEDKYYSNLGSEYMFQQFGSLASNFCYYYGDKNKEDRYLVGIIGIPKGYDGKLGTDAYKFFASNLDNLKEIYPYIHIHIAICNVEYVISKFMEDTVPIEKRAKQYIQVLRIIDSEEDFNFFE